MFDEDGFAPIDKIEYSIKNPEKSFSSFIKSFFFKSRLFSLNFFIHSSSFNHFLVPLKTKTFYKFLERQIDEDSDNLLLELFNGGTIIIKHIYLYNNIFRLDTIHIVI